MMFLPATKEKKEFSISKGKVSWESPSNIAIVKYWGKYGNQLPRNPSISFTLSAAKTITAIEYAPKKAGEAALDFYFEGKKAPSFEERIWKYLQKIQSYFPFLSSLDLSIFSENTFPHSSGIASSASAMSSLALCLCSMEEEFSGGTLPDFTKKASFISRLGSGSAARSVFENVCMWGELGDVEGSSNEYAVSLNEKFHSVFQGFHDDILIVSSEKKEVSSSAGHQLMENNPYAIARYKEANKACRELIEVLETGDLTRFGKIAEQEAMSLHALMMCSDPGYILMQPGTVKIIKKLWQFRKETNLPLFFTLDAGPNVHLLYPSHIASEADLFIQKELIPLCEDGRIIKDKVGRGPQKLI